MCTQTNCSNYAQTDVSLASNPNDSLRKAIGRQRAPADITAANCMYFFLTDLILRHNKTTHLLTLEGKITFSTFRFTHTIT